MTSFGNEVMCSLLMRICRMTSRCNEGVGALSMKKWVGTWWERGDRRRSDFMGKYWKLEWEKRRDKIVENERYQKKGKKEIRQ